MSKYTRCFDYVGAYTSEAWGLASGHSWDRLAAIAGEYQRGERTWSEARALLDDATREVTEVAVVAEPRTYAIGLPVIVTVHDDGRVEYEVDTSEAAYTVVDEGASEADAAIVAADHKARNAAALSFDEVEALGLDGTGRGLVVGDLVTEDQLRAFGDLPGVMVIGLDDEPEGFIAANGSVHEVGCACALCAR